MLSDTLEDLIPKYEVGDVVMVRSPNHDGTIHFLITEASRLEGCYNAICLHRTGMYVKTWSINESSEIGMDTLNRLGKKVA